MVSREDVSRDAYGRDMAESLKRDREHLTDSDSDDTQASGSDDTQASGDTNDAQGDYNERERFKLLLRSPCQCAQKRAEQGVHVGQGSCWAPFCSGENFEAACKAKVAFQNMHKLDQDRYVTGL